MCLVGTLGLIACGPTEPEPQPGPGTEPAITIHSPESDRDLPRGQIITVTYTITNSPTTALAFVDVDSDPTNGNETVILDSINGGDRLTFNFDTSSVPRGTYQIGIRASNADGTATTYATNSNGTAVGITVNGVPLPAINSPTNNMELLSGAPVEIVFSCNDPENDVSWSLFYDSNQTTDGGESLIPNGTGTGNALPGGSNQALTWPTIGVPNGVYFIGLTCQDPAGSLVTTYTNARLTLTDQLTIPTVTVTAPAESQTVFSDDSIAVEFAVSDPTSSAARVTVFVDEDSDFEQDESEIIVASNLAASTTAITIDSSVLAVLPDDTYSIGVFVEQDGQTNVAYAPGEITVIGAGDLTIVTPNDSTTVRPGTDILIVWNTNVPNGQAKIDAATFTSDPAGLKGVPVVPDPLFDAKDLEITPNNVTLDTATLPAGFYVVEITLSPVDENGDPTGDESSTVLSPPIRITTSPDVFWVGSIEVGDDDVEPLAHMDGLIFEGVNNQDNAGTSLTSLPLIDSGLSNVGAIMIGARYGKPYFTNPGGVGSGEAFLIYNNIGNINRRYSLNAVGTQRSDPTDNPEEIAGLRFSGIAFDSSPEDILNDGGQIDPDILSEDADGDGRLDMFDEDRDGDNFLDPIEDRDQDGNLDVAEDGFLGIDGNGDGVIDNSNERIFVAQYVNGALDTAVAEDRDGDGGDPEAEGDTTWGLSSFGRLPDADGDGIPELVFGFEYTDSIAPNALPGSHQEGFGTMVQENQFERGGIVVIPSAAEPTIQAPFALGRGEDRVVQLDFVGQSFDAGSPFLDSVETDFRGFGPGTPPVDPNFPYVMPTTLVDILGAPGNPLACAGTQLQVELTNNLASEYLVQGNYIITRIDEGGGITQEAVALVASAGAFDRECIDIEAGETINLTPNGVVIINPDAFVAVGEVADMRTGQNGVTVGGPANRVTHGVVGDPDLALALDLNDNDETGPDGCELDTTDGCGETIASPFYGFTNAQVRPNMGAPTHPLAYRQTLANPAVRNATVPPGCQDCARSVGDPNDLGETSGPPFNQISTGFYPGAPTPPIGARILGQGIGDRFGAGISFSPGIDARVLVGAPNRDIGGVDTGCVHQFPMAPFWVSSPDLAGVNTAGPKPTQYIVNEVGSESPNAIPGLLQASLSDSGTYVGADEGDRTGAAVIGIEDFNDDVLSDVVIGAPGSDGRADEFADSGTVYVIYRIPTDIEDAIPLDEVELPRNDPQRLNGLLINGDFNPTDGGDQIGSILASNCDLNDDGNNDIVIGSPLHGDTNIGEVIVVFGGENLSSPEFGYSIQDLVDLGRAVRIQGARAGDQAGFNIACDGDFDGDGVNDLVVSAPFATPEYDSNGDDFPDAPGLDLDKDGLNDGQLLDPNEAGLVYVITNTGDIAGTVSLSQLGGQVHGFTFVGLNGGDHLGGGFENKRGTRSQGISYAGDFNGDGRDDLLMSSIMADPPGKVDAGEVYLIFGFDQDEADQMIGN
jgi:hypothetical protein